jgi:ribosome biogenesis GTPase
VTENDEGLVHGVVLGGTGGVWQVRTDDGATVDASLRGRLKKSNSGKRADGSLRRDTVVAAAQNLKLAVGDDVHLERPEQGDAWAIAEILPRRSQLARRAPGGGQGQRIVAANVDQVVIMFAAAKPDPHPRMLDRFLVIAEGNDLPARIIINKVDLVGEDAAHARFDSYQRAGYPVHYTAVKSGIGLQAAGDMLIGRRSVLTGPSGVGKSSLLNALFPGANLRVGAISESVNKGQHTTVGALMLPLPGDAGYVIDTPGLREVGLWALNSEQLDRCFPEIRVHRDQCRFADCSHVVEPDCAVREALQSGDISPERYDSYLKLLEELRDQA